LGIRPRLPLWAGCGQKKTQEAVLLLWACPASVVSKATFTTCWFRMQHVQTQAFYSWWPRSHAWNVNQLVERTTRCLPAVRPVLDRVALPDISEVHDMWESWSSLHGLGSYQAIWFPPLLDDIMVPDAASATCCMVLKTMSAEHDLDRPCCIYPMYMTKTIEAEAALYSLHVIGVNELCLGA